MSSYLWQNFLRDSTYTIFIAQQVAKLCDALGLEQCIEIGPGKGALTKKLVAIVNKHLLLLEKDETLIPHLTPHIENQPVEILLGDALLVDTASLLEKKWRNAQQTIVVGNLPYYITSPLITKFFGWGNALFPAWVFMVQKEVADKVRTDATKKSFLWRLLNYQYTVKYLKTVPAKAFSPAPKVQSAVFSLIAKPEIPAFAYEDMIFILEKISMYKRKTLAKSRKMADLEKKYPLPADLAGKRLEEMWLEEMGRILLGE